VIEPRLKVFFISAQLTTIRRVQSPETFPQLRISSDKLLQILINTQISTPIIFPTNDKIIPVIEIKDFQENKNNFISSFISSVSRLFIFN